MPSHSLTPDARRQLGLVSIATLTTCLFKRGFRSQPIQVLPFGDPLTAAD